MNREWECPFTLCKMVNWVMRGKEANARQSAQMGTPADPLMRSTTEWALQGRTKQRCCIKDLRSEVDAEP